jgi:hypothetical protein
MPKFTTTMTVWHGQEPHPAGSPIELSAKLAQPLLDSGAIEPFDKAAAEKAKAEQAAAEQAAAEQAAAEQAAAEQAAAEQAAAKQAAADAAQKPT